MLQTNLSHCAYRAVPCSSGARLITLLAFRSQCRNTFWSSDIPGTSQLILGGLNSRSGEEEGGGGRGAQFEGEGAVGADGDAGGDWGARDVICCAGVELL